jgi:hypothetical protein
MSTSFLCHDLGSMAETVINPKGGTVAFFDMMPITCLKLQKESGYCG